MLTKFLVSIFYILHYQIIMYYTLFFICIITRIITSIYYIEDIDSLRFAYSIINAYSIKNLQPHFPGYPVFSFVGIVLYLITNSLGISFSIIGGTSTFIIIIYFDVRCWYIVRGVVHIASSSNKI